MNESNLSLDLPQNNHPYGIIIEPSSPEQDNLSENWQKKISNKRRRLSGLIQTYVMNKKEDLDPSVHHESSTLISERFCRKKASLDLLINLSSSQSEVQNLKECEPETPKKEVVLDRLRKSGFQQLAIEIEMGSGGYWDDIIKISNPALMQQVVDIYFLCQKKILDPNRESKILSIMTFALNAARKYQKVEVEMSLLGRLIFLLDKNTDMAIHSMQEFHFKDKVGNIKFIFEKEIKKICDNLAQHHSDHFTTGLQSPDIALNVRTSLEIAKALLTDLGTLNIGIINYLADIFLSRKSPYFNHETNLSYTLRMLQRSPNLRERFGKISQPYSSTASSAEVINVSLSLPDDNCPNTLQSRIVVLAALLSHLRQEETGSCFATSIVIEMLSCNLGLCISDLRNLVEEDKLTRHLEKSTIDIPFRKTIFDENLNNTFTINPSGKVLIEGLPQSFIWVAPGILAACQAIGVTNPKKFIKAIVRGLCPEKNSNITLSVESFIKILCDEYTKQKALNASKQNILYKKAFFAFSAQTSQPLLKVWENAIANMAESEENSMITKETREAIEKTFIYILAKAGILSTDFIVYFFLILQKKLYQSITYKYDPLIRRTKKSGVATKESGFVLYQKIKQHNRRKDRRIENENQFRNFLIEILKATCSEISTVISTTNIEVDRNKANDEVELKKIAQILTDSIDHPKFMIYLLNFFHEENKQIDPQIKAFKPINFDKYRRTPWICTVGNDSGKTLEVFFESKRPIQTYRLVSNGAHEALINIINMCKGMTIEEKELFQKNPNRLKPFCIKHKHRLPFIAGNPSLANAWLEDCPTEEWIERYVIQPGLDISNSQISSFHIEKFHNQMNQNAFLRFFPHNSQQKILKDIKKISKKLKVHEYYKRVLSICKPYILSPLHTQFITLLDTLYCQSLDVDLKHQLEHSAVHFADTNWYKGINDIYLCFVINIGTQVLELWEVYSNGTNLVAIDQDYWVCSQKWVFYNIPVQDDLRNLRVSY